MVTQESLQEKYSEYSNVDLLEIVSNKEGYTELAISVAKKEIVKRKLPDEVLKNYKSVYSLVFDDNVENWFVDLHLWEKILLYLIWVPRLRNFITSNFYKKEFYLKIRQGNFYLVLGVSFVIIAGVLYGYFLINFFSVLALGFLCSYLFDLCYNKNRQIESLKRLSERGVRPDSFEI